MPEPELLKECTLCGTLWSDCRELVLDPQVALIGYMAAFRDPQAGLVLVNHRRPECGTTLAIPADSLRELYTGPAYSERRTGTQVCQGHCLTLEKIDSCDADCDMAWIRVVMQLLRRHELPPTHCALDE